MTSANGWRHKDKWLRDTVKAQVSNQGDYPLDQMPHPILQSISYMYSGRMFTNDYMYTGILDHKKGHGCFGTWNSKYGSKGCRHIRRERDSETAGSY
jgi:hypothetical protein